MTSISLSTSIPTAKVASAMLSFPYILKVRRVLQGSQVTKEFVRGTFSLVHVFTNGRFFQILRDVKYEKSHEMFTCSWRSLIGQGTFTISRGKNNMISGGKTVSIKKFLIHKYVN